jgi:CBS domain-containing protein
MISQSVNRARARGKRADAVVDDKDQLVGIISTTDILAEYADGA